MINPEILAPLNSIQDKHRVALCVPDTHTLLSLHLSNLVLCLLSLSSLFFWLLPLLLFIQPLVFYLGNAVMASKGKVRGESWLLLNSCAFFPLFLKKKEKTFFKSSWSCVYMIMNHPALSEFCTLEPIFQRMYFLPPDTPLCKQEAESLRKIFFLLKTMCKLSLLWNRVFKLKNIYDCEKIYFIWYGKYLLDRN